MKGFEASGEAGSFETYKSRFSYGNRFQNGLEMILSGSYYTSEGDDRLFFKEFDDPSTNNGIAEDLDYDRFAKFFSTVTYRNFTLQGDYHTRKKGVPTASWETIFNEDLFTVDESAWVDLKYEQVYDDQLGVLARMNYNYYDSEGEYPYFWGDPYQDIVINRDEGKGQWLRGEVQFTKTLMEVHQGTFGLEYQYNLQQDQFNADKGIAGGVNLDDHRNTQFGGVYLQDEFSVIDHLTVNAGVRFDYYETFGSTINPRVSLIYNPCEKSAFKVIYGRAFRAPNAYELYFNDGLSTQKPNPDLDPETIDTYELVYEQYFGKHYRGTINGFYNEIHDLITLTTDPADGLLVFQNTDEVCAKGIEFEIEGKWPGGNEGTIGYTLQETENKETGKTLVNSPKNLVKINLIGALIREKLFFGVEEQYTSRRKTRDESVTDDFFITNLTLHSRNLFKALEVSGSIYNLFDKKYEDPGSEEHRQDAIEQDGRTFRIKLTYAF